MSMVEGTTHAHSWAEGGITLHLTHKARDIIIRRLLDIVERHPSLILDEVAKNRLSTHELGNALKAIEKLLVAFTLCDKVCHAVISRIELHSTVI